MDNNKPLIHFEKLTRGTAKTDQFNVLNAGREHMMGRISFYPQWRRYVFEPEEGFIWDASCLIVLTDYLNALNHERCRQLEWSRTMLRYQRGE